MAQLMSGQTAALILGGLALPVLGRVYDKPSMAVLGILNTVVLCIQPVSLGFCYSQAMPLATSLSQRRDLFVLSLLLGVAVAVVLGVAVALGGPAVVDALGKPELAPFLLFIPLMSLANSIGGVTTMALQCEKWFGVFAVRTAVQEAVSRAIQIGAGFVALARPASGLLAGALVGAYVNSLSFSFKVVRLLFHQSETPLSLAGLRRAAYRFRAFPMFRVWTDTASMLAANFPLLFFGAVAPLEVAGAYWMAKMLLVLPLRLFTLSSRQVFYVEAAERINRGESAGRSASEILSILPLLTAFPLTVIFLLGPLLFVVVLGGQWYEAGVYAQILAPYIAVSIVAQPLSAMFDATNRLGEGLVYNVILLAVQAAAMGLGYYWGGPRMSLLCYMVVSTAGWAYILARVLVLAGVGRKRIARALLASHGEAIVLLAPGALLYWWADAQWLSLAALVVASVVYLILLDRRLPQIRRALLARFTLAKQGIGE